MKQIKFEIEGVAPLKMDAWSDEKQPKNEEGYKQLAHKKVYRDEEGNIALPSNCIKAVMKYASSEIGKKMEAKKNRQTIMSSIFIEPINLKLNTQEYEVVRDIVTRGQGTKVTRVATYRPLIKEWKAQGIINSFEVAPVEFIKECLELGGQRYGLLSHRPEFGRFIVTKWEILEKNNGDEKNARTNK